MHSGMSTSCTQALCFHAYFSACREGLELRLPDLVLCFSLIQLAFVHLSHSTPNHTQLFPQKILHLGTLETTCTSIHKAPLSSCSIMCSQLSVYILSLTAGGDVAGRDMATSHSTTSVRSTDTWQGSNLVYSDFFCTQQWREYASHYIASWENDREQDP